MSIASLPSAHRGPYFVLRLALVAVLLTLLVWVNRQYFFHEQVYDEGDLAANSLSILRAEHGRELHGHYSRWVFHHPGPAVFYGEGLSELLLYRWWHLVPTPFNAQILFITLLMTSLLAAALSVAARWVRSPTFVVLVLAFGVLHFVGADVATLLMSNWPAHVIPMALLTLLVVTASVGAGSGEDLPLLVFAGCLLLHMHVAQPLFVGPMFVLAYAGLVWSGWRFPTTAAVPVPSTDPNMEPTATATAPVAPWRAYRRAHGWALLIAACFALPLLIDVCYGRDSNFYLILEHLRNHRGQHHSFLASLDYFLRFGVYQPSLANAAIVPAAAVSPHDVALFAARHLRILGLWLLALLAPLLPLVIRRWPRRDPASAPDDPLPVAGAASMPGRWRFLGMLALTWAASVLLTLFWGHVQDGPLYYFNAWFDYAIWFVLAILAAGALADALEVLAACSSHGGLWRGGVAALCAALAAAAVYRHSDQFKLRVNPAVRAYTQAVLPLLAPEPSGAARARLLLFPDGALGTSMSLAETVARSGHPVYVLPEWAYVFGPDHVLGDPQAYAAEVTSRDLPCEVWRVVPSDLAAGESRGISLGPYTLVPGGFSVDPAANFAITCAGPHPNSLCFVGKGWSVPANGEPGWTDAKTAWLQFRPRAVPAGTEVAMTFDFKPFLAPGKRDAQRIKMWFNGVDLGTLTVTDPIGKPDRFVVPAELWNKSPDALVVMDMPDAISPLEATGSPDERPLAFLISSLTFSTVPPVPASGPGTGP